MVFGALSKEERRFARNRAIEIIDGNPEIEISRVVEQIQEFAGVEATKIAKEAFDFRKVILIAKAHFTTKNLLGNGFDLCDVEIGTMEARKAIGSTLHGTPLEAAFYLGHRRYLADKKRAEAEAQKNVIEKKESRILVDGKPFEVNEMGDGNGWFILFSVGLETLRRNSSATWLEVAGKIEDVLLENGFDRSLYDPGFIAGQSMESHREWQLFRQEVKKFLDQAVYSDVCLVADQLMFLIGSLSNEKLAKKRAKLRAAIREEMVSRGIRYYDREMEQDRPRQVIPKEMVMPKTGKTQKRRESGALARHQQNRSTRAAENKLVASGGGSKKKKN